MRLMDQKVNSFNFSNRLISYICKNLGEKIACVDVAFPNVFLRMNTLAGVCYLDTC